MNKKILIIGLIMCVTNFVACMDQPSQIMRYHDLIQTPLPSEIKSVIDKQILDNNVKSNSQWWYCDKQIACKESGFGIKFSKNGKLLGLNLNKGVEVLDVEQEYKSIATFKSTLYPYARTILFGSDSDFLFVDGGREGTQIYCLLGTNKEIVDFKQDWPILKRFSPDHTIAFKVYSEGLWVEKSGESRKQVLKYKQNNPVFFDFDPKGNFFAISFWNGEMYIIHFDTYKVVFYKKYESLQNFCFSPCGKFLAVLADRKGDDRFYDSNRYRLHVVNITTGCTKWLWQYPQRSYEVEYTPCGKCLVISTPSGLEFIDSVTGSNLSYIAYKNDPSISFNPCGILAVSGDNANISFFKRCTELTAEQRYFKKLFGTWLCVEKPNKLIKRRYVLFTSMAIRCGISRRVLDEIWHTFPSEVQQGILRTMLDRIQFYGKD